MSITEADTGLGTTYERWSLNRLLARLQVELGLEHVFEGPGDGMTGIAGINSLILGRGGARVTLMLDDPVRGELARRVWAKYAPEAHLEIVCPSAGPLPFRDGEFDLAWNFNVMTRLQSPGETLRELGRISRKYVLICVPNRYNYSFGLHRLHHSVARQAWEHGPIELMQASPWRRLLAQAGYATRSEFWIDCPWWPDIVDPAQLIADFVPPLKKFARRAKPENRYRWAAEDLPYYCPRMYPRVHARMARLAFIEDSRWAVVKRCFAHHVGILASREGA